MATYNGHRNWNHWNVSLWINNDESLYNMARSYVRSSRYSTKEAAAKAMLQDLNDSGITKTPDGAPYSVSTIAAAMREL